MSAVGESETVPSDQSAERHFFDYLAIVLRRIRWFIAAFFVFSATYIFVNAYSQVAIYESQSMLRIRRPEGKAGSIQFFSVSFTDVPAEIQVIKSRILASKVVERLGLHWSPVSSDGRIRVAEFAPPSDLAELVIVLTSTSAFDVRTREGELLGKGRVGELFQRGEMHFVVESENPEVGLTYRMRAGSVEKKADSIRRNLTVAETQTRSSVLKLVFRSPDRFLAARVPNEFARAYIEWTLREQSEEAGLALDFIEKQLSETRTSLDEAEGRFRAFQAEKGVLSVDAAAQDKFSVVAAAEQERESLSLRRRQLALMKSALDAAIRVEGRTPAAIQGNPIVDRIVAQIGQLEFEFETKSGQLRPDHPDLKALRDQIQTLQRQLQRAVEDEDVLLRDRLAAFDSRLAGLRGELRLLPEAEQEFLRLSRDAKYVADTYTYLLQKREEAKITKAATSSRITLLDEALPPTVPISPDKARAVLVGVILGLVVAIGVAFLVDYLDDSVRDPDLVSRTLDLPLLGLVPWISPEIGSPLVTAVEPNSAPSEVFRTIRTNVQFAGLGGTRNVLLVTSPLPNEGKSTIAANLAVTLAKNSSRVLIVGCDLRKPTLHDLFKVERLPGLSEVLSSQVTTDQAIRPTGIEGLDILTSGAVPPNPLELLESSRSEALWLELRSKYDLVVLDAPPVLPVSDALILSKWTDVVLTVFGIGVSPRKTAMRTVHALRSRGAKMAGFVFNDPKGKSSRLVQGYGYRGYGYGYYYVSYGHEKKTSFFS